MQAATLESLCARISSGGTPSRKRPEYFSADRAGHLWVKSKELLDTSIQDTEERITDLGLAESSAKYFPENTVLVAMYGANVGQLGWLRRPATVNQAICGLVVNERMADWRFVFYSLLHNRGDLTVQAQGAAQQNLNQDLIRSFAVRIPPLTAQRRIGDILSAYDELIENSQRRIRILETMARALYRAWFVHFRFPGHEHVPRVPSAMGDVPQGWQIKTIADVCESVSYGYTASASRDEVGPKFLRITDIVPDTIDWLDVPFCEIPEDKAARYSLRLGDIVVARTGATTGYAKRLNKLHPSAVFASYLVRARAKSVVSDRMLGILMESEEYKRFVQTNIGGAAQPQANAVVLTSMPLAVPPSSVGEQFDRLVEPMIDEAELLAVRVQNLRRTRDLLLPRLLSGDLRLDARAV